MHTIHQRHRRPNGRTDGRTTYDSNIAHHAVKRTQVSGMLTDDFDDERVLDAAVHIRYNACVVAAVEQVYFIHANAEPRVVPHYL